LAPAHAADDPAGVAEAVVALHATDPASVHLSALARLAEPAVATVERALYDERTLLRMLGMRRTVFVVATPTAPVVQAACTDPIAARERLRNIQAVVAAGLCADAAAAAGWLTEIEDSVHASVLARGEATAAELVAEEPRLRTRIMLGTGKYVAEQNLTSRLLFVMAAEGRLARGRPRGSWTSTQHRWAPIEGWLPDGVTGMPADTARTELARHWLAAYGPATVADLAWWSGWGLTRTRQALAALEAIEVDLDGVAGMALPDDLESEPAPEPWVALLPSLDPTPMGWAARDWYLGPYGPLLFDRSGNIGPTVWCDGRIVGGWAQRAGGEIACRLLEDIGCEAAAAVEAAAARLAGLIGGVRFAPRFPVPLGRELAAG
jgi:hypothetical protein